MFKDITIGQYYPTGSVIHRLDPRTKLLLTFGFIVLLFVARNLWGYLAAAVFITGVIFISKIPFSYVLRGLRGIIFIICLTMILNVFMTPGEAVAKIGFLTITKEGIAVSVYMAVRLILLVAGTSVMTLATTPMDLTDGMEYGLRLIPGLKRFAHELSMMMSIALRFIPTLMEETDKIIKAQKARGADFESGNLVARAKALVPIMVPLFVSAFRRADELATAMEARCYRGGENRTRMKVLKMTSLDAWAFVVFALFTVVIIAMNHLPLPLPFPFN